MAYSLATSYAGESLLSGFDWFHGDDPTHGFVNYQSRSDAESKGLFSVDDDTNVVRLGVDHTNTYDLDEGRPSIRLESKESYNHGLFIADFLHMPPSQCGLWPAFWAYGSDWPSGGELDIIEGANMAHSNIISAHTADGCTQESAAQAGLFTGEQRNTECAIGERNIGCGYDPPADDAASYGDGFNAVGGGVYAMQWDEDRIRVWHFARGDVPADVEDKKPDPEAWGRPQAVFGGESCDVDSYWKNMSLVININFCGDYGDALWDQSDTCSNFAPTCSEYVANNPEAFTNAYWDVQYIDAYQYDPSAKKPSNASTTTTRMTSLSTTTRTVDATDDPTSATVSPTTASTTPTSAPVTGSPVNPAKISDYAYLGCFGSRSAFETFDEADDSDDMTLDRCVDLCDGKKYAGVFESTCYCADGLDSKTRATDDRDQCDHPCPGNPAEFCGGLAAAPSPSAAAGNATARMATRRLRREAPARSLLTVYGAVSHDEPPPQPPAMAKGLDRDEDNVEVITTTVCPTATPAPTGGMPPANTTLVLPVGAAPPKGAEWGTVVAMALFAMAMVL